MGEAMDEQVEAKIAVQLYCPGECGSVLRQVDQDTLTCDHPTCRYREVKFERPKPHDYRLAVERRRMNRREFSGLALAMAACPQWTSGTDLLAECNKHLLAGFDEAIGDALVGKTMRFGVSFGGCDRYAKMATVELRDIPEVVSRLGREAATKLAEMANGRSTLSFAGPNYYPHIERIQACKDGKIAIIGMYDFGCE